MEDFMKNAIVGIIVSLIVAFIIWTIQKFREKRAEEKIISFMNESAKITSWKFRSTPAISSHTNISSEKIEKICSKSKKIKRNEKEKESWKLTI
jgi:hypothetical protein